eukprot:COSAG01_NODE_6123_length_3838_cov_2.404011_4_plen_210_part_00
MNCAALMMKHTLYIVPPDLTARGSTRPGWILMTKISQVTENPLHFGVCSIRFLVRTLLQIWLGAGAPAPGGARSVLHSDPFENVNCVRTHLAMEAPTPINDTNIASDWESPTISPILDSVLIVHTHPFYIEPPCWPSTSCTRAASSADDDPVTAALTSDARLLRLLLLLLPGGQVLAGSKRFYVVAASHEPAWRARRCGWHDAAVRDIS